MDELERGKDRDAPTAAEEAFKDLVEERLCLLLDHYWWSDADGTPWMVLYLALVGGPEEKPFLAKTLRLDFDSGGICGGWSTDNMDWDSDLRAGAAGVDTDPPEGISMSAAGHTLAELAQAAADWFRRHGDEWERVRHLPPKRTSWLGRKLGQPEWRYPS